MSQKHACTVCTQKHPLEKGALSSTTTRGGGLALIFSDPVSVPLFLSVSISVSAFPPQLSVHTGRHWGVNVPPSTVKCGLLLNKPSCSNHQCIQPTIYNEGQWVHHVQSMGFGFCKGSFGSQQLQEC